MTGRERVSRGNVNQYNKCSGFSKITEGDWQRRRLADR